MKSVWWIIRPERSAVYPSAVHAEGEGGLSTGCGIPLSNKQRVKRGDRDVTCGDCRRRMETRHVDNPTGTFNRYLVKKRGRITSEVVGEALRRFKAAGGVIGGDGPAKPSPWRNMVARRYRDSFVNSGTHELGGD